MTLRVPTINAREACDWLVLMLTNDPQTVPRLLLIDGEEKMGKTHMVQKVFPSLLDAFDHPRSLVSLKFFKLPKRNHLNELYLQLREKIAFPLFEGTLERVTRTANARINLRRLVMFWSTIMVTSDPHDDTNDYLARQFATDLKNCGLSRIVFLFDAYEDGDSGSAEWLGGILKVILTVPSVRTVVAGRNLDILADVHASCCKICHLEKVVDVQYYRDYCHELGIRVSVEAIDAAAKVLEFTPGLFAERAPLLKS